MCVWVCVDRYVWVGMCGWIGRYVVLMNSEWIREPCVQLIKMCPALCISRFTRERRL